MSYRAKNYYRVIAAFGALLAFMAIYPNVLRYHLQPLSVLGFLIAGVVVGGGLGAGISQRWLRSLERKGEMQPSLSTALLLIGAVISLGSIPFFFGPNIPMDQFMLILVLIMPAPAATLATISAMFSDWERQNKRPIYGNWATGHGRLYLSAKPSSIKQ